MVFRDVKIEWPISHCIQIDISCSILVRELALVPVRETAHGRPRSPVATILSGSAKYLVPLVRFDGAYAREPGNRRSNLLPTRAKTGRFGTIWEIDRKLENPYIYRVIRGIREM